MVKIKKGLLIGALGLSLFALSGCTTIQNWFKDVKQDFVGLKMTIRTYDEQSQIIDEVSGRSVKIERETEFDTSDGEGFSNEDSKVINVTIGSNELTHVGSSMVVEEDGLENVFDDFAKKVDVENYDRGIPMINALVNDFKNEFAQKEKVILIRSQQGFPLATYAGDDVSISKTDVPSSTNLLVDGKRLFIYRCDYTIYDADLLLK